MLWEIYLLAQRTILRNVLRSSLTILGIVIGVGAVIVMVTLGSGATLKVTQDISKLGSDILYVRSGLGSHGPGGVRAASEPFELADATAIENSVAGLRGVAPTADTSGQAILGSANRVTSISGVTNAYFTVQNWQLADGRFFSDAELKAGKSVCILGQTVQQELFGSTAPIGKALRLGKVSFKVVGSLEAKGASTFGQDQDDVVVIPLRTFQRRIAGNSDVRSIIVAVAEGVSTQAVKTDIERLMRERRGIKANQDDDFHVRDMKEIIDTFTSTTTVMIALLSAVAGVSLLVGGIGIMNTMMVSVTERTREIGTRLAIGAMREEVLLQFLVEAVVLATFGGVLGILLGMGTSVVGAGLIGVPFIFKPGTVALAFFFSGAVGIAFGYLPAKKAAQLDPIEALRYE
ncbi:MAG: ABC transporter permease [Desulfobacterales bacterium]|nr:ABC transporter permease [Desulfobacterales bacterium]